MRTPDIQPSQETVFITNVDRSLVEPGERATGSYAQKIREVHQRSMLYGYGFTVLAKEPDLGYRNYLEGLGIETEVIVPETIDPEAISFLDGFEDPKLQELVDGKRVAYHMGDQNLYDLVEKFGGLYEGGDPGDSVSIVNDKSNYEWFAEGIVDVVPSELVQGAVPIAQAIRKALRDGDVYVRNTEGAGGLGNRHFAAADMLNMEEILDQLYGDQPDLWRDGRALVAPFINFNSSPGVTFDTGNGTRYHNLQITQNNDYVGLWSPTPEWIAPDERLRGIGDQFARRLGSVGFTGIANTDIGTTNNGGVYGFEINGRTPGSRHAIEVGERFLGQWIEWGSNGSTIRSLDKMYLKHRATFSELHKALADVGLLATLEDPYGAVITIPPAGNVAGIQVQGQGYKETEKLFREVSEAIGHPHKNTEDRPIFDRDMKVARS